MDWISSRDDNMVHKCKLAVDKPNHILPRFRSDFYTNMYCMLFDHNSHTLHFLRTSNCHMKYLALKVKDHLFDQMFMFNLENLPFDMMNKTNVKAIINLIGILFRIFLRKVHEKIQNVALKNFTELPFLTIFEVFILES